MTSRRRWMLASSLLSLSASRSSSSIPSMTDPRGSFWRSDRISTGVVKMLFSNLLKPCSRAERHSRMGARSREKAKHAVCTVRRSGDTRTTSALYAGIAASQDLASRSPVRVSSGSGRSSSVTLPRLVPCRRRRTRFFPPAFAAFASTTASPVAEFLAWSAAAGDVDAAAPETSGVGKAANFAAPFCLTLVTHTAAGTGPTRKLGDDEATGVAAPTEEGEALGGAKECEASGICTEAATVRGGGAT
mmetsp:Transcript_118316/g.339528  ORF Transcript_118316/g.339528 Transcript_118316/m.339528 type:complete len:246 (+) Transcript_118316:226-963(+)